MKKSSGIFGASLAILGMFTAANAVALGIQTQPNGIGKFRYHYVNKWPYGCVPVELSTYAKNNWKDNILKFAFNEWNTKVPNIFIFDKDNPPANTPSECLGLDVYLSIGKDNLSCRVINNSSHGSKAENQGSNSRILRLNPDFFEIPGTDLQAKGCLHGSISETGRRRAVIHEIGHALGFVHEHQRADASSYLKLETSNMIPEIMGEYTPEEKNAVFLSRYDYYSIMHYGTRQGAKNQFDVSSYEERLKTLIPIEDLPPSILPPAVPATFEQMESFQLTNDSISATDAAAANAFYAPGEADIGVELTKIRGCSKTRLDNGDCKNNEVAHQIDFKGTVVNHGAYDSGNVVVEYQLPSEVETILELDDSNCSIAGNKATCSYANMYPGQANTTKFKLVIGGEAPDEDKPYVLRVTNVSAIDELDYNDTHSTEMNTKMAGSMGIIGAVLLGITGFFRRRKFASL
ncbi:MAG: M12 family metallopeptidase [Ketobacteraceae bacterium]|nr:M12 family metallopeptidase [Ketobacteraceae bacterium]